LSRFSGASRCKGLLLLPTPHFPEKTGMHKASLFDKCTSFMPYFVKNGGNSPNCAPHTPDQIPDE
jgi:hypothetical protein